MKDSAEVSRLISGDDAQAEAEELRVQGHGKRSRRRRRRIISVKIFCQNARLKIFFKFCWEPISRVPRYNQSLSALKVLAFV